MSGRSLTGNCYRSKSSSDNHNSTGSEAPSRSTTTCLKFDSANDPCIGIGISSPTARTVPRSFAAPRVIVTGAPGCTGLGSFLSSVIAKLSCTLKDDSEECSFKTADVLHSQARLRSAPGPSYVPGDKRLALLESLDLCREAGLLEAVHLGVGVVLTGLHPEHFPKVQFARSSIEARVFRLKRGVGRRRHAVLPMAGDIADRRPTNLGADQILLVRLAEMAVAASRPASPEQPERSA